MTLLDLRHLAEWVSLVSLSGYACFLTFKGIAKGLDWLESRRQRRILRPPLPFPQRRHTDRVISEAEERRIYQSALSITQGRIQ